MLTIRPEYFFNLRNFEVKNRIVYYFSNVVEPGRTTFLELTRKPAGFKFEFKGDGRYPVKGTDSAKAEVKASRK